MLQEIPHSFPFADTVRDYVHRVLANKPEEQSFLGARLGTPSEDTTELRIIIPTELDGPT